MNQNLWFCRVFFWAMAIYGWSLKPQVLFLWILDDYPLKVLYKWLAMITPFFAEIELLSFSSRQLSLKRHRVVYLHNFCFRTNLSIVHIDSIKTIINNDCFSHFSNFLVSKSKRRGLVGFHRLEKAQVWWWRPALRSVRVFRFFFFLTRLIYCYCYWFLHFFGLKLVNHLGRDFDSHCWGYCLRLLIWKRWYKTFRLSGSDSLHVSFGFLELQNYLVMARSIALKTVLGGQVLLLRLSCQVSQQP